MLATNVHFASRENAILGQWEMPNSVGKLSGAAAMRCHPAAGGYLLSATLATAALLITMAATRASEPQC